MNSDSFRLLRFVTETEKRRISLLIKDKARETGFDLCGIAEARTLSEYLPVLKKWCAQGMNADMAFLARDFEKRFDPSLHLPGVKSVVVTGLSYNLEMMQKESGVPLLSRYAYGIDYHEVIRGKLDSILGFIRNLAPGTSGKVFVDSGTIAEKMWAKEAGLGWQGRHSIIINDTIGSFFLIGIILIDHELLHDKPYISDLCGDCRLCIEMCPTGAINEDRTIDARKCIANLTIENRGPIPEEIVPKLGRRVYGCDRCQEVCPWNSKALPCRTPEFLLDDEISSMTANDWKSLTEQKFMELFSRSAIKRVKYDRFVRNIGAALAPQP